MLKSLQLLNQPVSSHLQLNLGYQRETLNTMVLSCFSPGSLVVRTAPWAVPGEDLSSLVGGDLWSWLRRFWDLRLDQDK